MFHVRRILCIENCGVFFNMVFVCVSAVLKYHGAGICGFWKCWSRLAYLLLT